MSTATYLRTLNGWRGDARLYRVDPPIADWNEDGTTHRHVIVSAVDFFGPETYIFPASKDGEPTNMLELRGSYRGGLDHAKALRGAGYEVIE